MPSPDISPILSLFQTLLPKPVFDEICQRRNTRFGAGIFNVPVFVWLMILQRLQAQKTLLAVVQSLCEGQAAGLLGDCKRAREKKYPPIPAASARHGKTCRKRL